MHCIINEVMPKRQSYRYKLIIVVTLTVSKLINHTIIPLQTPKGNKLFKHIRNYIKIMNVKTKSNCFNSTQQKLKSKNPKVAMAGEHMESSQLCPVGNATYA